MRPDRLNVPMDREILLKAPKYEKADPEDMLELQEATEILEKDGRSYTVIETSFEDSKRYYCLVV